MNWIETKKQLPDNHEYCLTLRLKIDYRGSSDFELMFYDDGCETWRFKNNHFQPVYSWQNPDYWVYLKDISLPEGKK